MATVLCEKMVGETSFNIWPIVAQVMYILPMVLRSSAKLICEVQEASSASCGHVHRTPLVRNWRNKK